MQLLDKENPKPTVIPNVRTREGIRLRWFDEHPSNLDSGSLAGTAYLQDALLANWNPRASFIVRSPWENIGGIAPWFFGAYTRDLYDQAVSWDDQVPVPRNGRYHGNPFGPPQEGEERYVLFDLPRDETGRRFVRTTPACESLGTRLAAFIRHRELTGGSAPRNRRLQGAGPHFSRAGRNGLRAARRILSGRNRLGAPTRSARPTRATGPIPPARSSVTCPLPTTLSMTCRSK